MVSKHPVSRRKRLTSFGRVALQSASKVEKSVQRELYPELTPQNTVDAAKEREHERGEASLSQRVAQVLSNANAEKAGVRGEDVEKESGEAALAQAAAHDNVQKTQEEPVEEGSNKADMLRVRNPRLLDAQKRSASASASGENESQPKGISELVNPRVLAKQSTAAAPWSELRNPRIIAKQQSAKKKTEMNEEFSPEQPQAAHEPVAQASEVSQESAVNPVEKPLEGGSTAPKAPGFRGMVKANRPTGTAVRTLLRHSGLSIDEFAAKLNVTVNTVRRWTNVRGPITLRRDSLDALLACQNEVVAKMSQAEQETETETAQDTQV